MAALLISLVHRGSAVAAALGAARLVRPLVVAAGALAPADLEARAEGPRSPPRNAAARAAPERVLPHEHVVICSTLLFGPITCPTLPFLRIVGPLLFEQSAEDVLQNNQYLSDKRKIAGEVLCFADRPRGARSSLPRAEHSWLLDLDYLLSKT